MDTYKKNISVVIPVYNAEAFLKAAINNVEREIEKISSKYELILIDDGSEDNSWNEIILLVEWNKNTTGIKFDANYGQHQAIFAGIKKAEGDYIVVMDCDGQDDAETIQRLFEQDKNGNKIIMAHRIQKQFSFFNRIFSFVFNSYLSAITGYVFKASTGNYGVYERETINKIISKPSKNFYFPVALRFTNFPIQYVDVMHKKSLGNAGNYTFKKRRQLAAKAIRYAIELKYGNNYLQEPYYKVEKIITGS